MSRLSLLLLQVVRTDCVPERRSTSFDQDLSSLFPGARLLCTVPVSEYVIGSYMTRMVVGTGQ